MLPEISVVMAVYNTEYTMLRQAVESILGQTFTSFEFLIVLDCPTDGSDLIVREYAEKDSRIRIIENETNQGLACSLRRGVEESRGKYVARMDSDDIALPERFRIQYEYMQKNPDAAVTGARVIPFGEEVTEPFTVQHDYIDDQDYLKIRMLFRNVGVPHPTAMIRKSFLDEHGINYTKEFKKSQDYRLWVDVIKHGDIVMLPEILLRYRIHKGQISAQKQSQSEYAKRVSLMQIEALVGPLTDEERAIHFSSCGETLPKDDHRAFGRYLDRIKKANKEKKMYDRHKLETELRLMWCQMAIRRALLLKKPRMLFTLRMLSLLRPSTLNHYMKNMARNKEYRAMLSEFVSRDTKEA